MVYLQHLQLRYESSLRYLIEEEKERFGEGFVSRYRDLKQNLRLQNNLCSLNGRSGPKLLRKLLKGQPHEGELTGRIVDELRTRLVSGEQRTFSCPFATGGKSHRNRRRPRRRPMTTMQFLAGYINCSWLRNKCVSLDTFTAHLCRKQPLVSQERACVAP